MGWVNSFLGIGRTDAEVEEEAFPPVIGRDRQTFSFDYTHKHWVAEREVKHHIIGDIAIGVQRENSGTQKWSILMNNVKCDWALNCLPETYLFFNCIKRIEIYIDSEGKLLDTLYPISQSAFLKEKKRAVSEHVEDSGQRSNLKRFFERNLMKDEFLQAIIPYNPIVKTLLNALSATKLHDNNPDLNQIPEPYHIPGYFGNKAILPIKACWLYKPANENIPNLNWMRFGGLDEELYKKQELQSFINTLNGHFESDTNLSLEFSERYEFNPSPRLSVANLTYAESYLETIIARGWYKEEAVILQAHKKEVVDGQR
ncbi:hypothetical protein ABIB40_003652 [Pedobacter sp. UYP30]|uniref:hypothetical protein n=1 Tax=Pedobacter sp. UYP30 TaxID=1756400 RepID=UPI0033913BA0